jgi:ABC-type multidrug transport system fused ATPase/permease subunit
VIAFGRFLAGFYPAVRAWVNLRIDTAVRTQVFASIQEKDHTFFNRFRTGDLVTRLMDDIAEYPKLAWFSCSGLFRALESTSKLIFCVVVMFWLSAKLSLISILPLPIMLWIIYRLRQQLREAYQAQQQSISETNDSLESAFTGIRILKAFTAEPDQSRRLEEILERRVDVQFRVKRLFAIIQILNRVAGRLGQLVVIGYGGVLIARGELTLGTLYAIYIYLDMLVEPMVDLPNLFVTSRQAFVCMDREEEVLRFPTKARISADRADSTGDRGDLATAQKHGPNPQQPPDSELGQLRSINLRNIGVEYEPGRAALEEINLDLRAGEKIAVVGEIGSGKTTLLHLLAGLVHPGSGKISVNDRDIDSVNWSDYRSQIGFVPQESLLFSETIGENVHLGRESIGMDLDRVLEISGMREEIQEMQRGEDTPLGQKGTRISGGQRQRLSIARALSGQPQVLLLDDCTASLDAANEDRLWDGIDRWIPDAIVVLISHRLATIRRADRIVLLDQGRVSDAGTHAELEERSSLYREYLRHKTSSTPAKE